MKIPQSARLLKKLANVQNSGITFFKNSLFLQLEQKPPQINEKMLKTIRFKSSLCQKLEAELREKEDEIINTKTENFKLGKTVEFLQTNQSQQNQESEKDDSNTTKNLEARLEYLEQMVSESKTEAISSSMAKLEMAKNIPLISL